MTTRNKTLAIAAMVTLTLAPASGCGMSLDRMPLPAPSVGSDSFAVTATFANALNLPTKGKVKLNGADVGEVESMKARDYAAIVTMRIRSGVILPVGTTAELRSATPLGDVFVALTPPPDPGTGALRDGDNIPPSSTSAAATIEEVLTRAALLVNGGMIRNLTKVVNGLGSELGGRGDPLADLIAQTTTLVQNLSARSEQIRTVIDDAAALTATVTAQQTTVNDVVAAAGPAMEVVGANTQNIVDLANKLGQIARQLEKFPSVNGTGGRSMIADLNKLADGLNTAAADPYTSLDGLNSTISIVSGKVANAAGATADADITKLAIGPVPDPNFPGQAEAEFPDQADWANFVGSLAYNLGRLHDRVIGPGR